MIKIKEFSASVNFAIDKKGKVGITVDRNKVIFQDLVSKIDVGETFEDTDVQEIPTMELNFYTEESVNVLIAQLERVKKNINTPEPQYYLAC